MHKQFRIPDNEIRITAIRSQGPGGQNVNKVASAVHLRFDIGASSLPQEWKARLLALKDQRITRDGVIVIKAQQGRSQEQSRQEALDRLHALVASVAAAPRLRRPTRPTRSSQLKRLDSKGSRSKLKAQRGKVVL